MNSKNEKMKLHISKRMAVTAIMLFSVNASAEVLLEHSGTVEAGTEYHSNLQFLQRSAESVYLYSLIPQYQIKALDGVNEWSGQLGILLQRSSNTDVMGRREDPFATVAWNRQLQNGTFGLSAEYLKVSTRISQIFNTGLVTADGTDVTRSIAADWTTTLTEKLNLEAQARYEKTKFTNVGAGAGGVLNDFSIRNVNTEFGYQLNERVTPFIRLAASDFRQDVRVQFQDYLAGASVLIGPKFTVKAGAGITHFSTFGNNEAVGFVQAAYSRARSVVNVDLSRGIIATGALFNPTDIADRLLVDYQYLLTAKSRLGALVELAQNKTSGQKNQDFISFYERDFTPSLLMRLSLGVSNFERTDQNSANNNTIGISFTYNSPKF